MDRMLRDLDLLHYKVKLLESRAGFYLGARKGNRNEEYHGREGRFFVLDRVDHVEVNENLHADTVRIVSEIRFADAEERELHDNIIACQGHFSDRELRDDIREVLYILRNTDNIENRTTRVWRVFHSIYPGRDGVFTFELQEQD
jgi:hypothetical protein